MLIDCKDCICETCLNPDCWRCGYCHSLRKTVPLCMCGVYVCD